MIFTSNHLAIEDLHLNTQKAKSSEQKLNIGWRHCYKRLKPRSLRLDICSHPRDNRLRCALRCRHRCRLSCELRCNLCTTQMYSAVKHYFMALNIIVGNSNKHKNDLHLSPHLCLHLCPHLCLRMCPHLSRLSLGCEQMSSLNDRGFSLL